MDKETCNNSENGNQLWERIGAYTRSVIPTVVAGTAKDIARPLAYASEVGESVKSIVPNIVYKSLWGLSIGYVVVDTGTKVYDLSKTTGVTNRDLVVKTFDTAIWHSIASLVAPGLAIHSIVKGARKATTMVPTNVFPRAVAMFPTLIGLASIPMIIHPIDHATDWLMDHTFRQAYPPIEA
jgi:hypothetical protein